MLLSLSGVQRMFGPTKDPRIGRGLIVAHCHTNPEGRTKLKIEGSARAVLFRKCGRVLRQPQSVNAAVPRPAYIRVEQKRGLVVTGIRTRVPYGVKDFSAENSGPFVAVKSGSREGWGVLRCGQAAKEQKNEPREKAG